jgi:outer membrane protein OmpA-like peptidoglycan-associated protein
MGGGGDYGSGDSTSGADRIAGGSGRSSDGSGGSDAAGFAGGAPSAGGGIGGSEPGGTTGAGGRGSDDATIVGMVEAPANKVRIEEEVTPQTLGGMLPLTIGVDESGLFDFDKAVLRPEVKTVLDDLAQRLSDAEWDRLDIVGYTDRIGTDAYNQHLSEQRAWAVARYLMDKGMPLRKLKIEGRGARNSLMQAEECKDLGREELITCLQKDRRVEIDASIRKSHAKLQ